MKIVFFGTSAFAVPILEVLRDNHQLAAIVTTPDAKAGRKQIFQDSPVAQAAQKHGISVFKPGRLKDNAEFIGELEKIHADAFIVASYGKIIPQSIIDLPPLGTLNVHPSLLPKYRGPTPIQTALLNGDQTTGTSIMIIDPEMDHGPVLAQEKLPIGQEELYPDLSKRLADLSAALLPQVLEKYQGGSVKPVPQDHDKATYTKIIEKNDGRIDWNQAAQAVYNRYRAFTPWPGIWTAWNGKILKILECRLTGQVGAPEQQTSQIKNAAGLVRPGGIVQCGDGSFLELRTVQLEGKKPTAFADFARGNAAIVNSILL